MKKTVACCFTGPRSPRLPAGGRDDAPELIEMKEKLRSAICDAYESGYRFFMSGMAEGFDLIAAETVLELKKEFSDLYFMAVFPSMESRTKHSYGIRKRIENILLGADLVIYVQNRYNHGCELQRNIYMVDSSWRVIGYYDGCSKGTAHCWRYAENSGLEMINLYDGEIFE